MIRAFLLAAIFSLSACATLDSPPYARRIKEIDVSLIDLQHMVSSFIPIGVASVSPNGREFYSKHFVMKDGHYTPAAEALDRYFVQMTVLGDQRPYDVEIIVTREVRVLRGEVFDYATKGHDVRLAKQLEIKFNERLSKRREDRNIIDDFRVF